MEAREDERPAYTWEADVYGSWCLFVAELRKRHLEGEVNGGTVDGSSADGSGQSGSDG
jgi:hypothetical protein